MTMTEKLSNQSLAALAMRDLLPHVIEEVMVKISTPGTPEHEYVNAPTYNPPSE